MTDDLLIGYALDVLDPAGRAAVAAHLAAHPDDAAKVELVRRAVAPLAADRDGYDPPAGLAVAAIARTAEYAVAHGLLKDRGADEGGGREVLPSSSALLAPAPSGRAPSGADGPILPGRRPVDVAVAAAIALLAVGIGVAGVGRLRQEGARVAACQNNLREVHQALAGYGDTHGGRYPQVGTPGVPVAGAFALELARAGQLPADAPPACPEAAAVAPRAVGYSYTLGYLAPGGRLAGLTRADGPAAADDWTPVSADLPELPARPGPAHPRGQNVLYAGGTVRFSTTPAAGVNGDDIYRNEAGLVRAGLHRDDASLGRPDDAP